MKIEEMKVKLEQINKELEELQLEGVSIVLVSKDDYRSPSLGGRSSGERHVQIIKGRLHL